jgi:ABC-type antimicrobial peptide transport system permease subunit
MTITANDAYDGFATLGRVQSMVGLYVIMFICLFPFIIGIVLFIYSIKAKSKYTKSVTATLSNVNCNTVTTPTINTNNKNNAPPPPPTTSCNATASYIVNGKTYAINSTWPGAVNNQSVTIQYDPSNPADAVNSIPPIWVGIILVCVSVLIVLFAYFMYWLAARYKAVAAVEGVGTVGDWVFN